MRISIAYFHLLAIAALATMVAIPYVAGTMLRSMLDSGKIVRSAESYLKRKCTFTMAPMNITLRNCPIRRNTSQHVVLSVSESFVWGSMAIPVDPMAIYVRNVAIKSLGIFCHDDERFCIILWEVRKVLKAFMELNSCQYRGQEEAKHGMLKFPNYTHLQWQCPPCIVNCWTNWGNGSCPKTDDICKGMLKSWEPSCNLAVPVWATVYPTWAIAIAKPEAIWSAWATSLAIQQSKPGSYGFCGEPWKPYLVAIHGTSYQ